MNGYAEGMENGVFHTRLCIEGVSAIHSNREKTNHPYFLFI